MAENSSTLETAARKQKFGSLKGKNMKTEMHVLFF